MSAHRENYVRALYAAIAVALITLASPLQAQVMELPPPRAVSGLRPILFEEWEDPSSTAHTFFGRSVSIFGNTALVGIPGFRNDIGRVGIFRRDGTGQWHRAGSIENPTVTTNFGTSVGLTRDFAFIGFHSGFASGAYVFRRTKHGGFRFLRNITRFFSIEEATGRLFTTSQAVDGSTIVKLSELDKRGRLHVVDRFTIPAELTANEFRSAAIWDDVYVLTNPDDNDSQGAAYVFEKRHGRWRLRQKLIAIDGIAGDAFGSSVAVHGDTIVIGASAADAVGNLCNGGFTTASGSVYVFKRRQGIWSEDQKLKSVGEDPRCTDRFGSRVFLSGKVLMIFDDRSDSVTLMNGWHAFERQFGQYQPVAYRVDETLGGGSVYDLQGSTFFQGTPSVGCCDETGKVDVWDLTP
jgi:hypothetical protein